MASRKGAQTLAEEPMPAGSAPESEVTVMAGFAGKSVVTEMAGFGYR
jgi:hypothetical protein